MAQNRVFRVIKSGFLDYLKKILPYTFDFFGLAELQIMPKDAQAWKKPMLTRSLHSYGFEFKFFWSKHKKLKKCKNLGFFNFSDLFWMFTNGFRLWTIFFVQKNTFFRQNRKKVKIRWFFGNSENQLYLVTFGNDFFFFLAKLNVLWELYHQGCLTPQLWKSVSRTCCSLAAMSLNKLGECI